MKVSKKLKGSGFKIKIKDTVEGNVCDVITNLLQEASRAVGSDLGKTLPRITNGNRQFLYLNEKVDVSGYRKGLRKYIPTVEEFSDLLVGMNDYFGKLNEVTIHNAGFNNPLINWLTIAFEDGVPNIDRTNYPYLLESIPDLNNSLNKLVSEVDHGLLNNESLFNALISLRDYQFKPSEFNKNVSASLKYDNAELSFYLPHKLRLDYLDYFALTAGLFSGFVGAVTGDPVGLGLALFCGGSVIASHRDKTMIHIRTNNDEELILRAVELIDKTLKLKPSNDYQLKASYRC